LCSGFLWKFRTEIREKWPKVFLISGAVFAIAPRIVPYARVGSWPHTTEQILIAASLIPYITLWILLNRRWIKARNPYRRVILTLAALIPILDAGLAIYMIFFTTDPLAEIGLISLPVAWMCIIGFTWAILRLVQGVKRQG
jgi:hypothetical protein